MPTNYDLKYPGATIDDLLDIVNALTVATQSADGLMSSSDKIKLDGMTAGAEPNVIDGVTIDGVAQTITNKKVVIGLDTTPATNSKNLMTSGSLKVEFDKKADKDTDAVEGNIAVFDGNGNPVDGGVSIDSIGGKPGIALGIADVESAGTAQMFTKRQSGGGGVAVMKRIKGNSIVWNEKRYSSINAATANGITDGIESSTGYITLNGTAAATTHAAWNNLVSVFIIGRKYYFAFRFISGHDSSLNFGLTNNSPRSTEAQYSTVFTASATGNGLGYQRLEQGTAIDAKVLISCVDLTLMFGAGNEPSTAAEFEALYPLQYYAYNTGSTRNNTAEKLVSTGFNQWDEVWEFGTINGNNGQNYQDPQTNSIRSKNYCRCFPNTAYFSKYLGTYYTRIFWYDANKAYIGVHSFTNAGQLVTSPSNAAYFRIAPVNNYGATYKSDICINLSDASRNGTYEPYQTPVEINLGITTMTGKKVVNGSTEGQSSVVIFGADGMKGVGAAYDETDGKKANKQLIIVDLGDSDWILNPTYGNFQTTFSNGKYKGAALISKYNKTNVALSSLGDGEYTTNFGAGNALALAIKDTSYADATAFKTAMAGVKLIYELATPEEYILDNPINMMYFVDEDGTEEVTQPTGAAEPAAPFRADVNYSVRIQKLVQVINSINQS